MPHKANPTWAAAVIGMSGTAAALASAAYRAMEVPQERASGEWQIEWVVLPQLACLAAGALARATDIAAGLRVDERAMAENLRSDGGLILAEAYMMRLAPVLGRERAHDLVTGAAERVRGRDLTLADALRIELKEDGWDGEQEVLGPDIEPGDYVGTPELACAQAVRDWRAWPEWRD
jgi:3-carboxy-cis,cis-muconate cycloisomerase